MKEYIKTIGNVVKQPFYMKVAVVSALLFGWINFWLLNQTTYFTEFFRMATAGEYFTEYELGTAKVIGVIYAYSFWILTALTIVSVGIAIALMVWLFRHSRFAKVKETGLGVGGTIIALFTAGCPVCGAFLFSLIGVAGGIGIFPLKGIELKVLSLALVVGSIIYAAKSISKFQKDGCENGVCNVPPSEKKPFSLPHTIVWVIIFLLAANQLLIGSISPKTHGAKSSSFFKTLLSAQGETAREIIATKVNPDGKTTSVVVQPTITEVPAEPKGMDTVEAATVVMVSTGIPFYAPDGISFDDPIGSLSAWGTYEKSITLSPELEKRWQLIISTMTCDYCCGSPTRVTPINNCGCDHAKAFRSISKYLLQNYGDKYSNEEILGELQRWKAIWYPKGVVEDYLLATGRGDIIGHKTHGGAGADGMHGVE